MRGVRLSDEYIEVIFRDEGNIISQNAKDSGVDPFSAHSTSCARRQLLTDIYHELGQKSISVPIKMYPEEYAMYNGRFNSNLAPSSEAKLYIQKLRQDYIELPLNQSSFVF